MNMRQIRLNKEITQKIPDAEEMVDKGRLRRKDLAVAKDLKSIFKEIRNHLAGMTSGITRDEAFAQEIINLLFCKIYDEVNTAPEEYVSFWTHSNESLEDIQERILLLFGKVKQEYKAVFGPTEQIKLDPESVRYVVTKLQNYVIKDAERDAIGDAFEAFIGPALRGAAGQFFTPRNVIKMMIKILDPSEKDYLIDPACGSGGFLIAALDYIWTKLDNQARINNWSSSILANKKKEFARKYIRGIEKDTFLAKVARAYMALIGDGRDGIFCENSLRPPSDWSSTAKEKIQLNSFDIVVTNPPHGSKIVVKGKDILQQYDLAYKWSMDKKTKHWIKTDSTRSKQSPQILFIERCLQLLRPGGRLGIILPEGLFGNPSYSYIVEFLRKNTRIISIISMPEELFQPHTHNKTCIVFVERMEPPKDYPIFMGIAKWCGHDSRGNNVPYDDVPRITTRFRQTQVRRSILEPISIKKHDRLGFITLLSDINGNILVPKYYDPEILSELESLHRTHELIKVEDLVRNKVVSVATGVEVGKLAYGTGNIPFVRTSDIANWEIKIDPKLGVSEEVYSQYNNNKKVKENDILLVRDGTYLIGTTGMITRYDTKILFQSHIYRLRVEKPDDLSPFLLLAMLNSPIVKKQIRAKQFTQGIIDSLGSRLYELVLPIPRDHQIKREIIQQTKEIVTIRANLRHKAREVSVKVQGRKSISPEDRVLMELI
jgi:type I restriction enzyme M protein